MKEPAQAVNKCFLFYEDDSFLNQIAYGSFITIPNPPCPLVPYVAGGSNSFQ
jgi:hypothetical protein